MGTKIDLNNSELVFLDIETSSLKPDCEILAIGGLITDKNLNIKETFEYLIKMKHPEKADPKALEINGYSEEKWKDAYELKKVLEILHPKFKNKILVGWISHFDWSRLERVFYENGLDDPFDYRKIDVFSIAVAKFGLRNLGEKETLTKICRFLNIDRGKSHTAFDDAYAAYKVFFKIFEEEKFEKDIIIYTDGGAINNPGPSAIGVIIKIGPEIKEYAEEIGNATNNQAEYQAVIFALEKIKHLIGKERCEKAKVVIHLDSEIVGKQLSGEYKISEPELQNYFIKFYNLKFDFGKIEIKIIPREENKQADNLVKSVLFHKLSTII